MAVSIAVVLTQLRVGHYNQGAYACISEHNPWAISRLSSPGTHRY